MQFPSTIGLLFVVSSLSLPVYRATSKRGLALPVEVSIDRLGASIRALETNAVRFPGSSLHLNDLGEVSPPKYSEALVKDLLHDKDLAIPMYEKFIDFVTMWRRVNEIDQILYYQLLARGLFTTGPGTKVNIDAYKEFLKSQAKDARGDGINKATKEELVRKAIIFNNVQDKSVALLKSSIKTVIDAAQKTHQDDISILEKIEGMIATQRSISAVSVFDAHKLLDSAKARLPGAMSLHSLIELEYYRAVLNHILLRTAQQEFNAASMREAQALLEKEVIIHGLKTEDLKKIKAEIENARLKHEEMRARQRQMFAKQASSSQVFDYESSGQASIDRVWRELSHSTTEDLSRISFRPGSPVSPPYSQGVRFKAPVRGAETGQASSVEAFSPLGFGSPIHTETPDVKIEHYDKSSNSLPTTPGTSSLINDDISRSDAITSLSMATGGLGLGAIIVGAIHSN